MIFQSKHLFSFQVLKSFNFIKQFKAPGCGFTTPSPPQGYSKSQKKVMVKYTLICMKFSNKSQFKERVNEKLSIKITHYYDLSFLV